MMRRLRRTRDKTKQRPVRRKMKFEALEPRILLSADLGIEQLVPHIDPLLASAPVVGEVLSEESSASQGVDTPPDLSSNFAEVQKKELVIVDSSVEDYQSIIDQIADNNSTDYQIEVLSAGQDGLQQISEILQQQNDLSAVHVISHGSSGSLSLGTSSLNITTLNDNAAQLQFWGEALTEEGDILLYGCSVAEGEAGVEFVERLAALTKADIAASEDLTGSSSLGGDWILETARGAIENLELSQTSDLKAYQHLLADIDGSDDVDDILVSISGEDDTLTGGTGDDIYQFQDNWGSDVVVENELGGTDTLDFWQVTADLTFTFGPNGSVVVSDGSSNLTAVNIETIKSGTGKNDFVFGVGAVFVGTITGNGNDTFDFTTYDDTLTFSGSTIRSSDLSLNITHSGIDDVNVDFAQVDITDAAETLKTGLDDLVDWAAKLQEYEEIGQTLSGVASEDGVTLGNSLNIEEAVDLLRDEINLFIAENTDIFAQDIRDRINALSQTIGSLTVGTSAVDIFLTFVNGQPELVFDFTYTVERTTDYLIDLGKEAEDIGLAFDADFSLLTTLNTDLGLGLKLKDDTEFFFNLDNFELFAADDATWDAATPLNLDIGFLAAEATGSATLSAAVNVAAQNYLNPEDDPNFTVTIDTLSTDFDLDLAITVPEGEVTGLAAFDDLSISLADGNPFAGQDIDSIVYTGFGADNLGKFKEFNAATFISQVGTVRDWFGSVTESDIFTSIDIPFVTPALNTVFDLADAVGDTLLYDDGDDGDDDGTTLVVDLREALAAADLDEKIRVEGDGEKITFIALDSSISSMVASGATAIGFDGSENFENAKLTANDNAPDKGVLTSDVSFSLHLVEKGVLKDYTVNLTASSTANNETIGNDHAKLLDENNQATFKSAQDLANKLIEIFGFGDNVEAKYDATSKRLTFELKFSPVNYSLDVPVDFSFDLSPIGNIGTAGSPDISLGAGIDIELTLGLDLSDSPAGGGKDLEVGTNLTDLKGIDDLADAIKTEYSLSPEVAPTTELSDTDIVFINSGAELIGKPQLEFNSDTIKRKDGIDWADDGFREGQQITVTGSSNNNGSYEIVQISGSIITISAAELTAETKSNVNISGPAPTLTESPELSFSAADRTIIRNEGSWVEDGFASGSYIVVEGAGENNGVYQIETVNDDILVLTSAALLVAQENVKNVTVTVPDRIEFSDDNPGFQAGQLLSISGTQTNNRSVLIADALEVNGATWLMLSASSKLADESLQDDPDLKLTGGSIIRLSADATFEIDGVAVKVLAQPDSNSPYVSATSDNNNPFDLVNDINSALDKAGLKETIKAKLNNGQIILTDISDTVGSPFVLTTEETNPAHTELGFATTQTADSADLLITLSDNTLEPYRITLDGATTIQEVINRIEAGTNNQVKVEVNPDTNAGLRLIQVPALTGNPRLSFDATANSILFDDVGLSWADYGFVADQQIRVSGASDDNDGTYTIDSITGHELKISGDSLAAQQSIKDVRITLAGSEIFRVEAINGSKAAGKLGILKADVSSDVDDSGKIDVEDSDGVIIGDAIAGVSILDRFFIQDPKIEGNVFINAGDAATDGITVTGDFGFISVDLNGYGAFDTTLTLDLDDPTPDVAGITVNELIDSLSHIDSIVSLPSIGGPEVSGEELIFADKTIVRSNNEVWDNFSVGEYISVTGAAEQNDGHYKISAIAGSILTLELDENFVSETITGATVLNEIGSFRFNLDVVPDFGLINEEQASALVVALFDFGNPFADTDFNSDKFTLGSDDKSVTLEGDWSDRIKAGADLIAELEASLFAGVVYVSENSFQLNGDQSKNFELGAKVTALLTAGAESKTVISKIKTINYDEASNQTTFTIQDSILTADLSSVSIVTNDVKTKVSSVSYDEAANETRVVTVDKVLTSAVNSLTVDTPREIDYLLQLPDLGELVKFDEIGISQILDGLIELSDFLGEFEAFGFLDEPIPIIDVSVNDVLSFADKFDAAVQEANNNPAGTLQVLEAKLKEALGIPFGSDSDALGFTERLSSESGILTGNDLTDADVEQLKSAAVFLLSLDNGPSQLINVETETANTIDDLIVNVNAALSVAFASKVQARRSVNDEVEFFTTDSNPLAISNPIDFSIYEVDDVQMFRIDFGLGIGFTEALDVEFDLGDTGILSGAAGLEASGAIDFALGLGMDLNNPTDIYLFDSSITGQLEAIGDNLSFRAGIGPLGVFINGGEVQVGGDIGNKLFSLGLDFDNDNATRNGRKLISDIVLADDFSAEFSGSIAADLPVYFPAESLHKGSVVFTASLSVDEDGNLVTTSDLGAVDTTGADIAISDLFTFDLNELSLMDNMLLAVDGIDAFLEGLQDVLDGEVFGLPLPLIGDKLSDSARFIEDFRDDFIDPFRDEIENLAVQDENIISELLFDLLGPAGIGLLLDANTDDLITIDDITLDTNIDVNDGNLDNDYMQWNLLLGQNLEFGTGIGFDLGIPGLGLETQGDVNLDLGWELDFGFGISFEEAFYLDISDESELEVFLDVTLPDFGLTGQLAFLQLDAAGNKNANDEDITHFSAMFGIDVYNKDDENDERLAFSELGSIGLDAGVAGEAIVDLHFELKLNSELMPGIAGVFPKVVTEFFLDWSIDGDEDADGLQLVSFSELSTNLIKDGLAIVEFQDVSLDLGSFISDFIDPVLGVVREVTEPLQPIIDVLTTPLPVISDLGPELTILDLAEMTGKVDTGFIESIADMITFINAIPMDAETVMLNFGDFTIYNREEDSDLDITNPNEDVQGKVETPDVKAPAIPDDGSKTSGFVDKLKSAGDFDFPIINDPSQIFNLLLGKEAVLMTFDLKPLVADFSYKQSFPVYGPLAVAIIGEIAVKADFAFGFDTYGITEFADSGFRNPALIFNGFYVSDTDLPTGEYGTDVPELTLSGGLGAAAELNLGIASAGVGGGVFFDVLFNLFDPSHDGKVRVPEMINSIINEFRYGGPVFAPMAMFDVSGEVYAKLFAYIEFLFFEIGFDITPPITLVEFDIPFTRVPTLATELGDGVLQLNMGEFASQRLNNNTIDGDEIFNITGTGSTVNVSAKFGGTTFTQTFSGVSKILALAGEGDDIIDLKGLTSSTIEFELDGGVGNDQILLSPSAAGAAVIYGGVGDDLLDGGSGNDQIYGGAGNDRITGGSGDDVIFGDEGEIAYLEGTDDDGNTIVLTDMQGNKIVDYIRSRVKVTDGDDLIDGDADNDKIFGGGGEDEIDGGTNNDLIIGDGGILRNALTITARNEVAEESYQLSEDAILEFIIDGENFLLTLLAVDTVGNTTLEDLIANINEQLAITEGIDGRISAEPDADGTSILFRATYEVLEFRVKGANEIAVAGLGLTPFFKKVSVLDDTTRGEGKADTLRGGTGNDVIYAGRGNDILSGDDGDDQLYGEDGFDLIYGNADNDRLFGGEDNDQLSGGANDDHIEGGAGNDQIWGDWMVGEVITGVAGVDSVWGGTGLDTIFGGGEGDFLFGDSDPDKIFGEAGNDTIDGGHGADKIFGGTDDDKITSSLGDDFIDGGSGSDDVTINVQGGDMSSLVTVFDSGAPIGDGTDMLIVNGTEDADRFLLRAARADIFDATLVDLNAEFAAIETELEELGVNQNLQLDLSSAPPRAFIAKLNNDENVERINYYDNMESIIINTLENDDQVVSDNTNAEVTINGGDGDDLFQVGQLFNSPRDEAAGIDPYDLFDTVQTTKGFLSSGINAPMTINGEDGEDSFVVFRNLHVLTLNGGDGDDEFLVKAFALEGSVDDPDRDRTDIDGEGGADLIQYAVNAPVGINGGDGLDTVIVLGTEFGDDFVVTAQGIYGAGLNVSFTGIEVLKLDTAEGNDRIFVQSTGIDHLTEIYAGEGSDTFFIAGDTPPVVSQDLLGHSGIITHEASSADERFNGVGVDGISANVGDNDEPFVRIIKDDGLLQITEDGLLAAQYSLVLSRPPGGKVGITAITPRPSPNDEKNGVEYIEISVDGNDGNQVVFDENNWFIPQIVTVTAVQDLAYEGAHIATINHVVTEFPILDDPNYEKMAIPSVSVEIVDDDLPGLVIEQTDGTSRVIEGADFSSAAPFADTYTIRLNQQPEADVTVELINEDGQLALEQTVFTFTQDNWAIAQTVRLIAADDGVNEGFHHGYLKHLVGSNQDDQSLSATDTFAATIEAEARNSVLLSYAPIDKSAISSVQLGDDLLDADRYRLDQKMLTILDKDGQSEMVTEQIIVSYEYIKPGFQNVDVQLVGVEIGDNDAPGVLVLQSGGSTNVIEVEDAVPGNSTSPYVDQYQVVLTARPDAQVRVDISPQPTKTSARPPFKFSAAADNVAVTELGFSESSDPTISLTSGGPAPDDGQLSGDLQFNIDLTPDDDSDALITVVLAQADMSGYQSIDDLIDGINAALKDAGLEEKIFSIRDENRIVIAKVAEPQHKQVSVTASTLIFTPANWNVPQTVTVSAINDDFVDGGESKSFAQIEQSVARIQGPLIINGAGGDGSDAGLGADPFRLPGETNDVGNVVEIPTGSDGSVITDQIVLDGNDIDKLGPTYFKSLDTFEPGDENNDQKAKIYIIITSGPGSGQERVVVARNGNTFILAEDWDLDDLPTDESRYIFKRQLGKVNEAEQVDVAMVYNNESLADNVGTLTATHLYGLGMGPDLEIGGLDWKGGMTYTNLENLTINLGAGNDQLEITGIQNRDDFQTVTVVNTGAGDDEVHFNGLQAEESGLFALHLEQGDDIVTAENTTAPLIIFGDDGVDTIQSGDGDDIIFADFGRVDYLDTSGELITRFGMGQRGEVKDAVIPAADLESVPFAQTDGNYYGPSLVVSRLDDSGGNDSLNGGGGRDILIGGFGTDTIAGGAEADIIFGDNGRIDFATSGHIAQIRSSLTFGASDVLNGGDGNNLIFGGFGADGIISGKDDDIIFGDNGVANYTDGDIENLETTDTDASTGGADNINAGDGDNVVFGGVADDQVVSGAGDDVQLGDNGRVDFVAGRLAQVASGDPMFGGKDRLAGGGGNDLLIGGAFADELFGEDGNDYLIGDAGRANYKAGALKTVETMDEHRFIGDADRMEGGRGYDAMFGGYGNDIFIGDMSEDLMIGEYARLTMEGDRAESVVRLGQGNLDLIANRQFGLYNPLALTPSLSQLGSVLLPTQIREFIAAQRPELATDQRPTHHGATSSSAKDQGLGYHPPEDEVEEQAAEEDVDQPSPDVEKLPEEERVEEVESEQPILEDENEEDQDQAPEEMEQPEVPEEKQTDSADSLKAVVAGFVGWGVTSSQRKKTGTAKLLDLDTPKEKARFWRWQDGRLSKSGWAGNDATKTVQYLNVESPIIKTELKRKENV